MAYTLEQIEALSDEELRQTYNDHTQNVQVGLAWWREELRWRALDRRNRTLELLTWWIALLTLANVVLVAVTVVEAFRN